jgi:hypothetical protein
VSAPPTRPSCRAPAPRCCAAPQTPTHPQP